MTPKRAKSASIATAAKTPARRPKKGHRLVWIDCEMTGLDENRCVLLEIATIVTESDLTVLAEGPDLVIRATDEELAAMPPVVRAMHAKSGLTERARKSKVTLAEAEEATLDFIRRHCRTKGIHPLCGNSIATDRRFLARYMPRVDRHLSYRMVDVSTVKELARRWYPGAFARRPEKRKGHRALADIRESIEELRWWRESVFRP
jgi:oligoribonuclease